MTYEMPQPLVRAAGATLLPGASSAGCVELPEGSAVDLPQPLDRDADR